VIVITLFGHSILENPIQALSRTFRHRFKDFQGPCLFSRTFQALKIWRKKFKDFQGLSRTRKSPEIQTGDIVAAAETVQVNAESLEWNFQTPE